MSSYNAMMPWKLKFGILGLVLSTSPFCIGDAVAQAEPAAQAKTVKPADNAPAGYPLDKAAAARKPEGMVTVDTIEGALEAAYRNNTEIKELQAQLRARDEGVPQALAGWRPTVNLTASIGGEKDIFSGDKKTGDGALAGTPVSGSNSSTAQAAIELRQNLYNGGGTVAKTCQAESLVQAARAQLSDKESQILFAAVQAYFNVMEKAAELQYKKSNETSLKGMLEATQAKFNVGEETRTSIAQAEANLASAVADRELAEATLLAAEATFEQVTGARPGKLKKPGEPSILPRGLKEAIEIAKKNHPSILAALHQERADRANIKVSDSDLLPKLDLQGKVSRLGTNYTTSALPGGQLIVARNSDFTTAQSVSLNLTVPIYEAGAVRGRSREFRETAEQRRIAIETARRKIIQQLVEAWETYLAAKASVVSYKIQVKGNEVALEGTRQEMLVGSKILLDVLNAQRDLVGSQLNLVRAEQNYYQACYNVLANMGRLNALDMKLKVKRYDPQVHYHDVRNSW